MQNIKKPSWFLNLTEIFRAIVDLLRGLIFRVSYKTKMSDDRHPVLVVPGFLGSDFSTSFLRKFITEMGHPAFGWGLGRNLGDLEDLVRLTQNLEKIYAKYNQKVTLIGWSLGGVYARELAKQNPQLVHQVITLGSPFKGLNAPNHARWVFDLMGKEDQLSPEEMAKIPEPAPVLTTAVYTKQDGIVPWQMCMEDEEDSLHRNIEVWGSHCGLIFNPKVLEIVVAQLQPSR